MAYVAFTQAFGPSNAGATVYVKDTTGKPAYLYSSGTGGLISDQGVGKLDSTGTLSVFVDGSKNYTADLAGAGPSDGGKNEVFLTSAELAKLVSGVPGVTYILTDPPYDKKIWDGSAFVKVTINPGEVPANLSPEQIAAGAKKTVGVTENGDLIDPSGLPLQVGGALVQGSVGATPIVVSLAGANLDGKPLMVSVNPVSGSTVSVEYSSNGTTYTALGSATARTIWSYDLGPSESWITHLRFSRTAGTGTTSTYSVAA